MRCGGAEAVLGHRAADAARDALGAVGDLVAVLGLAPLLGAVGVADRHAHHRDRVVHARHRRDARDAPPGADDHLAVDRLAQQAVGAADVVGALRRDRRRLEAEARRGHRRRRRRHDLVVGLAPVVEREVVVLQLDLDPGHGGVEHPQRLLEQLLPGLVALEDDDAQAIRHVRPLRPAPARRRAPPWRRSRRPRARRSRRPAPRRPRAPRRG